MQLEDYFEFLEPNDVRIEGHWAGIESILRKYLAGRTVERVALDYDTLRLVDILLWRSSPRDWCPWTCRLLACVPSPSCRHSGLHRRAACRQ